MEIVNINEAKTHFLKILARVNSGEEIVIVKSGKPYAKITPIKQAKQRIPGIAKGKVTEDFFEPLPEEELGRWE
ncbi:prevent-host-death family protein [sediment metagenome]|uniref:Prevent-host-death family protein n=1 Tax=sediment metagenome TaxID=749907 RepID=D9PHZ0_9ZZZZ